MSFLRCAMICVLSVPLFCIATDVSAQTVTRSRSVTRSIDVAPVGPAMSAPSYQVYAAPAPVPQVQMQTFSYTVPAKTYSYQAPVVVQAQPSYAASVGVQVYGAPTMQPPMTRSRVYSRSRSYGVYSAPTAIQAPAYAAPPPPPEQPDARELPPLTPAVSRAPRECDCGCKQGKECKCRKHAEAIANNYRGPIAEVAGMTVTQHLTEHHGWPTESIAGLSDNQLIAIHSAEHHSQ